VGRLSGKIVSTADFVDRTDQEGFSYVPGIKGTDERRNSTRNYDGRAEWAMDLLKKLVKSGEMSAEKAAQHAGMTLEQFLSC